MIVNDYPLTESKAVKLKYEYIEDGYDDVLIEELKVQFIVE